MEHGWGSEARLRHAHLGLARGMVRARLREKTQGLSMAGASGKDWGIILARLLQYRGIRFSGIFLKRCPDNAPTMPRPCPVPQPCINRAPTLSQPHVCMQPNFHQMISQTMKCANFGNFCCAKKNMQLY